MIIFLGILLCFSVVNLPFARGTCGWEEIAQVNIDDTIINKQIFNYTADESFEFTSWAVTQADGGLDYKNALNYFQYSMEDNTFFVQTTDNFGNLNSDAYTDGKELLTITLFITLKCGGTNANSMLLVAVQNTNQNAPEFSQKSYTYSIPMPIMPKTDFSVYGDEMITATDIDFSTSQITFSIDPDDFTITSIKTKKTFQAVFRANKIVRFDESKIYTLTATDSGSPAKSTPVTITLNADTTSGLDSPSFTSAYYSYNYTSGSTPSLIPTSADIVIQSDKPNEATYSLNGDYAKLFSVDFKNTSKTFPLTLNPDASWPEDISSPIILTLSYTTDAIVNAIILITVVNDVPLPEFSSDYYIGSYDIDTNIISWIEPIKVSDASTVEVTGDKSSLFTFNPATSEVTPKNPLSKSDFDDNLNLFLTLVALSSSGEVRATVVISLSSPDELKFDSAYYYGIYSIENEKGVVTLDSDIGFSDDTDFTGITIVVDNSYKNNFKVEIDSLKWKITVQNELNTTVLSANSELAIPITASKTGESAKSTAVLILTLPEKVEINFSSYYYSANYIKGSETELDSVILDSKIIIEGADASEINITPEGYKENFQIIYNSDSSSYEVGVIQNLNSSILDTKTQLIITINAAKTDESTTTSTILVLNLPEKTSFNFEEKYYVAEYIVDSTSKANVKIADDNIKISGANSDKTQFTFEGYNDNFEMVYDEPSSAYTINVKSNLDPSVIATETQLIITITAVDTDTSSTASTVLVLALPDETSSFKFENEYYAAEYILDSTSKASVTLIDDSIKVTGADPAKIEFTFEGYTDNFDMTYDSSSSAYTIIVKSNLDSSILASQTHLIITITAADTDTEFIASTVLVLSLPDKTSALNFENKYYAAEYIVDSTSGATVKVTDGSIKVTGADSNKIQFTFEGFNDNFEMIYDETSSAYTINVKSNLNPSIIATETQLIITITAVDTDTSSTASTVLVLALPDETSSLKFENEYYAAEYILDSTSKASVTFIDDSIKVTGADPDKIEFTFEGYTDNFEMTYDASSSTYTINVKSNLDSSILASETHLIITISAADTDTESIASTVLVLSLPDKTSSLNFENKYYAAEYILDSTSKATVFTDGSIKVTGADSNKIEFTFEGFNDNFEMIYDETSSAYAINVKSNLNPSIIATETQLIITITAVDTDTSSFASTVLVLALPDETSSLKFENEYYAAEYILDSTSKASVTFIDDSIKLTGADPDKIEFTFEGYTDNFEMTYDASSSTYTINVKSNLDSSILASETHLIITISAADTDTESIASTVLVLSLPDKTSSLNFENKYYAAEYILDSTSKATVKTDGSIKVTGADSNKIQFTFEGFNDNFEMIYDETSSAYTINVISNLNPSVITTETQLIITITAVDTDTSSTASTVLVLALPDDTSSLKFENEYYAAEYILDSTSKASVKFTDESIKVTGAEPDQIEFTFKGYNDNFQMEYDSASASYNINVKTNLNSSLLNADKDLIITITATTISATGTTVLILKLPEISIKFEEQYYTAEYIVISTSEARVQLDKNIVITNSNSLQLQFLFEEYDNNFDLELNSTVSAYDVIVTKPLDESVLSSNTQLIITITASSDDPTLSASTVLVLNLQSSINPTDAFENDYYVATYIQSTTTSKDHIDISTAIKIKSAEFAETNLKLEGYNDNFIGTCDSSTLICTITVQKNLNSSILSSNPELLITLIATNKDGSSTGKTVLMLRLPSETFTFTNQHYYAVYTIQKSGNEKATVKLNDSISFEGANSAELSIVADEYPTEFDFKFDTQWNLLVTKNLDSKILSENTELVISLTATKAGKADYYSKATLVIKLPDKITMAFLNPQYSGEYIVENGEASVTLTDNSEIKTTDNNVQITLESYTDNFEVTLDSNSKWTVNVGTPLDTSIFIENKQLKLLMTITKVDVQYGEAALIIKLPDPNFSQGFYIATYSDEDGGSISGEDIKVVNVEPADIRVNLSDYNEYFYTDLAEGKWTVKLSNRLPADITQKHEILLTTLEAIRNSDNTQFATSTLLIKLPDVNSTNTPEFAHFAFYGEYKNSSETSSVELKEFISFTNLDIVTISAIDVEESSEYAANFKAVSRNDGTYSIEVTKNLDEDVLEKESNIVLTLVAIPNEGNKSYAALVITLPKMPRETSVQFKDEEILYSGTYENGTFTSQSITIETNSTDDTQISVEITNELRVDNKYFIPTYKNKVLSVSVDELPDDILKKYAVIPLKLAITDTTTGDKVHAVLNVNVNYTSDDGGGGVDGSSDGYRVGLLVAVIILAILLIAVIIAFVLFWYFKIRNTKYAKMEEEEIEKPTTKPTFTKNLNRQTSIPSNSALRRPTGLPIGFIESDTPTEEASSDYEVLPAPVPTLESDKKVAFNDTVQNIDEYEVDDEELGDNLQNVAARRPTQFVFGYPMEAVLDSLDSPERRESSDYIGFEPEKKKSVEFDENVERMHIDVDDEENEENKENEENDLYDDKNATDVTADEERKKFKAELEVKLEERLNELSTETV